jgi:hypothetical protein
MDLLTYISEVKQFQNLNQTKLTMMNYKIEMIKHNNQVALKEIRTCKLNMSKVETALASLTTKQETETAFNKILSMFGDVSNALRQIQADSKTEYRESSDSLDLMFEDDTNHFNAQTT